MAQTVECLLKSEALGYPIFSDVEMKTESVVF